ncbi:MAG: tetratricopeptide repeat protein [Nitrospiria bacterium]
MFPFLITTLLFFVIASLVFPFFRKTDLVLIDAQAAAMDEERVNLEIERQSIAASLSELEVDFEHGKVSDEDYARLKLDFEHRLLAVLDGLDQSKVKAAHKSKGKKSKDGATGKTWVSMIMVGLIMIGGSTGAYQLVHWKLERAAFSPDNGGNMPAASPIDPKVMVARLEKKLKENPDDLQGQMMIGRSYMAMERWDDAEKAWTKVIELDPRNYTAYYRLGEIILSHPKTGTREEAEKALGYFDQALVFVPQDASILWARGIVLLQLGRASEADEAWTEAYQYIPRGTDESNMVQKALEDLRGGKIPGAE